MTTPQNEEQNAQHVSSVFPPAPKYAPENYAKSAWKSVPKFVRFAVWLWAIGVVLSIVAGVLVGIVIAANA